MREAHLRRVRSGATQGRGCTPGTGFGSGVVPSRMRRRHLLSGLATLVIVGSAGCVGGSDGGASESRTATASDASTATTTASEAPTATEPTAGLTATTLVPREECADPGGASVRLDDNPVAVVGCVIGRNGCTRPRLSSVDRDGGAVRVVVAAVDERNDEEACTEALVNLGYEVQFDSENSPTSVTVVHDDVDGRRVVAEVTP